MPEENKLTINKKGFELTEEAQSDLKDIWVYIAENSESAANKYLEELLDKLHLLAENTKLGKMRDEILLNLRSFAVRNHIIFYTEIASGGVEIYRVLHGSRDIDGLFQEFFEGLKE